MRIEEVMNLKFQNKAKIWVLKSFYVSDIAKTEIVDFRGTSVKNRYIPEME